MVNIKKYCKNPGSEKYQNLPPTSIAFFNSICAARKTLGSSKFWHDIGKKAESAGEGLAKFPLTFVAGMLTPQGMAMLSEFFGIKIGAKLIKNMLLRGIKRGIGEDVTEAISEKIAEEGAFYANNAILSSVLGDAVADSGVWAYAFEALEYIGDFLSEAVEVVEMIMLLGQVFDALFHMGFNQEVNPSAMQALSNSMNLSFRDRAILVDQIQDQYGQNLIVGTWPIEWHADNTILPKYGTKKEHSKKMALYITEYLGKLKYNSNGVLINYGKHEGGTILNKNDFNKFIPQLELMISDQNTAVASWIARALPIIIVVIILFIGFLLFIK
jgi:hypothetical protein